MQYSTNYNFNLPEGTDLWNYLTQTNPNFTSLDTILKGVSDATVTTATEVASGTAHAITRTLPDANVIRFTATSNWVLGDTMTIDGTPVTVVKPNGTNLQSGDYVIGAEVLGVLRATQFTVYLGAPSSLDAADITYDNTGSGLTATDVQDAIDEVNSNLSRIKLVTNNSITANASTSFVNVALLSNIKSSMIFINFAYSGYFWSVPINISHTYIRAYYREGAYIETQQSGGYLQLKTSGDSITNIEICYLNN